MIPDLSPENGRLDLGVTDAQIIAELLELGETNNRAWEKILGPPLREPEQKSPAKAAS